MKIMNLILSLLLVFAVVGFCDDTDPPQMEDSNYLTETTILDIEMNLDPVVTIEEASPGVELIFQYQYIMRMDEEIPETLIVQVIRQPINKEWSSKVEANPFVEGLFSKHVGKVFNHRLYL